MPSVPLNRLCYNLGMGVPRKRRWFQFRLRTLLIATMAIAVGCAWLSSRMAAKRRERVAVETLRKNGWAVTYDYQLAADGKYDATRQPPIPDWLGKVLGDDFFCDPSSLFAEIGDDSELDEVKDALRQMHTVKTFRVCGSSSVTDRGLSVITDLTQLESLEFIASSGITDASIPRLKRLTKLKWLSLNSRHVSEQSLRELKTALPRLRIADLGDDEPE